MKSLLCLCISCFSFALFSQSLPSDNSTTRAVIIGVSDYDDRDIPDLQFAHKDAEAFLEYLQSPAGGAISEGNYKFLTNEKATRAQIAAALAWLMEVSKKGDKVIIYFSGHGDVESQTMLDLGYLLAWDSPSKLYMAGGVPIHYLQATVATLSLENQSEVLLVTDACRAGKLAGSSFNGTQLANSNLAKQFANEVKILSCQPNEFSMEGREWGGGRGVFSYHLIEGLLGLADRDEDLQIKLFEIDRYLEDKVPSQTSPHSQYPMVVGNKGTLVSMVDSEMLATLKERKAKEQPQIYGLDNRALASMFPENLDSNAIQLYETFTAQVDAGNLLSPEDSSAYDLYLDLMEIDAIKPLHGSIKRNLAAALQDESQSVLNGYLKADPVELQRRYKESEKYAQYPKYIEKAAEILGPKNYFYKHLLSNLHYFEGLQLRLAGDSEDKQDSIRYEQAILKQQKALSYQPQSPYVLNELGVLHTRLKKDLVAFGYYDRVIELAPEWGLPYVNYSIGLYYTGEIEKAIEMGERAGELLPEFPQVYVFLAWINAKNWEWTSMTETDRKGTELKDDLEYEFNQMSSFSLNQKRLEKSLDLINNAIKLDSTYAKAYFSKGMIESQIGRYDLAAVTFLKYTSLNPLNDRGHSHLAIAFTETRRYQEAEQEFLKAIELNTEEKNPHYGDLGQFYSRVRKYDLSIQYFLKDINQNRSTKIQEPIQNYSYLNLANVYLKIKKYEEMEFYSLESLNSFRGGPMAYYHAGINYQAINRFEDSEWVLKKAIDMNPDYNWAYYYLGFLYGTKRNYKKAIEYLNKSLESINGEPNFELKLGMSYFLNKQPNKAEEYFQKVIQQNKNYLNSIGWFYKNHSEFDLAKKYLLEAIDNGQLYPVIYANLAVLFFDQEHYIEATKYLEEGMKTSPESTLLNSMYCAFAPLSYDSEKIYEILETKGDKYPQMHEYHQFLSLYRSGNFEEALKINKVSDSNLWVFYLSALIQSGQLKEAEIILEKTDFNQNYNLLTTYPPLEPLRKTQTFKKFIRKFHPQKFDDLEEYEFELPEPIYYYDNCLLLGQFYEKNNEWKRAEHLYHKAMELELDSTEAYQALKVLYKNNSGISFEKSETAILALIDANPENWEAHKGLAVLYWHKGEKQKSISQLELILKEGYKNNVDLIEHIDLENFNSKPEFKAMMEKYFPGKG